jgi:23S rRNA (cytidine1920-2'-O)/16S rRNA (cytidine1409-2'-O)-methyltransferase
VYAVDVGYGQLAWSLRSDERVVCRERVNARGLTPEMFGEKPSLTVIDVSFISLRLVLPAVKSVAAPECEVICLVKPQFEAGREKVGKRGVVRELSTHIEVLEAFFEDAVNAGFAPMGLTYSPIRGPQGNIEFLGFLRNGGESPALDIRSVAEEAHKL